MTTQYPKQAAQEWATQHPTETAIVCVINVITAGGVHHHTSKLASHPTEYFSYERTRHSYYEVANGNVIGERLPYSKKPDQCVIVDIRPPATRIDPQFQMVMWDYMKPTDEIATCPDCGATGIPARAMSYQRYIRCDLCGVVPVAKTERTPESQIKSIMDQSWNKLHRSLTYPKAECPVCHAQSEARRDGNRLIVKCCGSLQHAAIIAQHGKIISASLLPDLKAASDAIVADRKAHQEKLAKESEARAQVLPVLRIYLTIDARRGLMEIVKNVAGGRETSRIFSQELARAILLAQRGEYTAITPDVVSEAQTFITVATSNGHQIAEA